MIKTEPLPWQHAAWDQVTNQAKRNRLTHAFLVKGVAGLGKLHFAKVFSHWLLCERADFLPCMTCKNCLLVQAGSHPDCLIIKPIDSKMIKVDQVRKLNDFAHKTAQQGGRRVIIISPAEAMNLNASNALLKSLEEPGEGILFLLISHRPSDLLPTIRSRCHTLAFSVPTIKVAINWLRPQLSNPQQTELLLDLAAGSPLQALKMANSHILTQRDQFVQSIKALLRGELTAVELGKEWQGQECILAMEWLAGCLEDIIRLSLTHNKKWVRNHDLLPLLQYLSNKSEHLQVVALRDWILKHRHLLLSGANLNEQLIIESIFCRLLELVM